MWEVYRILLQWQWKELTMGLGLEDYYKALGQRESGGDYKKVNDKGYIGKY